jgi:putative protease
MKKLKLKVPINCVESAKHQIKAGAGEFYMALNSEAFNNLTFSGRGKGNFDKIKTSVDYNEFAEIVKLAHDNQILVEMTANLPFMMDDYNGKDKLQKYFLKNVEQAILAGADRIIVADIGNILMVKEYFPEIPITASVFLETFNIGQVQLFESLGVKKIVLDHCVTLQDIETIVKNTDIDIEAFCHFGCSFIQFNCTLFHSFSENFNLGLPCRAGFNIKETGEMLNILDVAEDCAICKMKQLGDIGVSSVKITGRDLDYKFAASITYIYSYALSLIEKNVPIEEILKSLKEKFDFGWWDDYFCKKNRCKYTCADYYT